eukprot:g40235.t1
MAHINSSLPTCLNPLQFANRHNRPTENAISLALHSPLEHLGNKDNYIRLLLVDYSSAFNTTIPSRLISKLRDLRLGSALCNWILSFLTHSQDRKKGGGEHTSTNINGIEVEIVKSIKVLRVM